MLHFSVSDYAQVQTISGAYLWRGYLIRFAEPITLTAIFGGATGTVTAQSPAYVALFHSNAQAIPTSLISYGVLTSPGTEQVIPIPATVVVPGEWYLLMQAGTSGSNNMASVLRWDVPSMVAAEKIFEAWHPVGQNGTRGEQFYGYNATGHPNNVVGMDWSRTGAPNLDARPYVGFQYEPVDYHALFGHVYSAATEEPLPDVTVEFRENGKLRGSITTNAAGYYERGTFFFETGQNVTITYSKEPEYVTQTVSLSVPLDADTELPPIYLESSPMVSGYVFSAVTEEPIADVDVQFFRDGLALVQTVTNINGHYEQAVPPGEGDTTVVFSHPAYLPHALDFVLPPTEEKVLPDVYLSPLPTVAGYVFSEETELPLEQAKVQIFQGGAWIETVYTNSEGYFEAVDLELQPGEAQVFAEKKCYVPATWTYVIEEHEDPPEAMLYLPDVATEIRTPEDLFNIRYCARESVVFRIMNDIHLAGFSIPEYHPLETWERDSFQTGFPPIRHYYGTRTSSWSEPQHRTTALHLDGQGYTISNLTVKPSPESGRTQGFGLLAGLGQGSIRNLTLTDVDIGDTDYQRNNVGAFVGGLFGANPDNFTYDDGVAFENCHATGALYGESNVGGLVGNANNQSGDPYGLHMEHCTFDGSVTGINSVGGLIGKMQFVGADHSIRFCSTVGTVQAERTVGGLIGTGGDYGRAPFHLLKVEHCFSTANVTGSSRQIGGLMGVVRNGAEIRQCYTTGTVTNTGENASNAANTGGLFGQVYSDNVTVAEQPLVVDCYSRSPIIATGDFTCTRNVGSDGANIGGIAGSVTWDSTPRLINCYYAGTMSVGNNTVAVGGIVGAFADDSHQQIVQNCYYDSELSGLADDDGRGEPRTTEQMTYPHDTQTTYMDWEFGTIWSIDPAQNDGYPQLRGMNLMWLSGHIEATSKWMTLQRLLRIWAKRQGAYVPVTGFVKHDGVYKPITKMYRKQDGIYRE